MESSAGLHVAQKHATTVAAAICAVNDRNSLWEYIIRVTELVTPNSGFKVGDIHTISKTKNKNWANYVNWHFWKLDDPHAQTILEQDKLDR